MYVLLSYSPESFIYRLRLLLQSNFALLCVLAVSAISQFLVAAFLSSPSTVACFFCHNAEFCCRTTETVFSHLRCIFHCFICVCSIWPSQWMCVTTSASTNKNKNHHYPTAVHFVPPLHAALCFACQLSRTYPCHFLEGRHSYIVYTLVLWCFVHSYCVITSNIPFVVQRNVIVYVQSNG